MRATVRRGDVTLSCLVLGSGGPPVVLLHGLAGGAEELRATAEALAPRHRVVVPDQRGHGRSTRRPGELSREAYAVMEPVAARARWDEWRSVTAPTLLVRGEHGNGTADEDDRMRELRPDAGYAVIAGAGHDAHLDRPEAWIELLRAFLAG